VPPLPPNRSLWTNLFIALPVQRISTNSHAIPCSPSIPISYTVLECRFLRPTSLSWPWCPKITSLDYGEPYPPLLFPHYEASCGRSSLMMKRPMKEGEGVVCTFVNFQRGLKNTDFYNKANRQFSATTASSTYFARSHRAFGKYQTDLFSVFLY